MNDDDGGGGHTVDYNLAEKWAVVGAYGTESVHLMSYHCCCV